MNKNFKEFIETLKPTLASYDFYVDFDKVFKNINKYKNDFKLLNNLIGSQQIKKDFINLIEKNPEVLKVVPKLLATRDSKIRILDKKEKLLIDYDFSKKIHEIERYCYFMEQTGLFNLLQEGKISNLEDYMIGLEVGMDTNGRKNRSGKLMENLVEKYLQEAVIKNYKKQANKEMIKKIYNLNLDDFIIETEQDQKSNKCFDFVTKGASGNLYLFETNFYNTGGSKLNEVARSYENLAKKIKKKYNQSIIFIWITDGIGWKKAKKNLEYAYKSIEHIYNIHDLEMGILKIIIK